MWPRCRVPWSELFLFGGTLGATYVQRANCAAPIYKNLWFIAREIRNKRKSPAHGETWNFVVCRTYFICTRKVQLENMCTNSILMSAIDYNKSSLMNKICFKLPSNWFWLFNGHQTHNTLAQHHVNNRNNRILIANKSSAIASPYSVQQEPRKETRWRHQDKKRKN